MVNPSTGSGTPRATALDSRPAGLADHLEYNARAFPGKAAIIDPRGGAHPRELTYGALQLQVEELAAGLRRIGVAKGTKTVLMARPGPDLFALVFALFRIGAVPVVVDPGMGVRRMLHCYRAVGAEAFIGPPLAHAVRVLSRRTFARTRIHVTLGRRWFWAGHTLAGLRAAAAPEDFERPSGEDLLMIGFTTGSTGPAKGVEYTHRMAAAMARQVASAHGRDREDVSLVTLPLYGMLDLVLGSTLVLAPVDPVRVASADPAALVGALAEFEVTTMFASPALLRALGDHLAAHPADLPALRSVVSGGAPVAPDIVAALRAGLGEKTEVHVTYGATEALPISSIESAELLGETAERGARGDGTCVGRPVPGIEVRIVAVTEEPLPSWDGLRRLGPGEVGEIVVAGEAVSTRYHASPAANAHHKIVDRGAAAVWHRTGDLGYLDGSGRLWFCGRKAQRVRTADGELHTVRCEGVFTAHPLVNRTALVGVGAPGAQRPVLCVETVPGVDEAGWQRLLPELRALATAAGPPEAHIHDFLRHPAFPVDIRHNAKIGREELAVWATRQLERDSSARAAGRRSARRRWGALRTESGGGRGHRRAAARETPAPDGGRGSKRPPSAGGHGPGPVR
ncbi:fatty acid CoA ligase family protein [Streptomyces pathocidini]|uniref:fatty acid CoA ligase family protein n=1 Tax=Streptomyces pathocidini TaxID=1650571 RepID=UPI0033D24819